jgi:hypothetical protein
MTAGTRSAALAACGLILSVCVAFWAHQGDQTVRIAPFLALYGLAFLAYVAALIVAKDLSLGGLRAALVAALFWRLALVLTPPLLSNDINRYVWEGRVQVHGGNPYAWGDRPDSPRWVGLRDPVWQGLNHKDYPAVYPPLFQLACRGVIALDDSVVAMKAFLVACELLTLWPLAVILRRRGLPRERLLILAWSPLALVEIAGSGHNEALGFLFLAWSLAAMEAGRPLVSAVAAALGFQAKFLPGLVAAAWARRYRVSHVLVAAAVAVAVAFPYYDGARKTFFLSLSKLGQFWRFNETLFAPLAAITGSHPAAVRLGVAIVVVLALVLAWRRTEPVGAAMAVVAASLLLGPNVLPWYALWLLPLLVVRDEPALLLFTGTAALAYFVYPAWQAGEVWHLGWDVRALEYLPCLLVFAWPRARPRTTSLQHADGSVG